MNPPAFAGCLIAAALFHAPAFAAPPTWWSLRPLTKPAAPALRFASRLSNPVDAFVLAKLREKGLEPAPEADRRTLIRRLTFDLIGLPPTPEEVEAFEKDASADAYEKLVDRLLASPHYGERWARHWMDAAHFAETHGHDQDRVRPNAWRYRDYLIAAFNADTPYGRFVREQVAADVLYPDEPRLIPALGFLAAGPWDESSLRDIREDSLDRQVGHYLDRDDMVTTVMGTVVSLTVHCSRCHDHKFDPIPQSDYYRLQSVFAGVGRADRAFDPDPAVGKRRGELTAKLAAIDRSDTAVSAVVGAVGLRRRGGPLAGLAVLPPTQHVYAAAADFAPDGSHRPIATPRAVHVLRRGDVRQPMAEAIPGSLGCVPGLSAAFDLPVKHAEGARRAALAKWLTDPANPLTWRSIVNRVWHHHFGRGLVDTPNDFGKMGGTPSHPELLDWLAVTFRDGTWANPENERRGEGNPVAYAPGSPGAGSLKALHRLIVTSAVYRQSSRHHADFAKADADNRYLWRMPRMRLDAEQVRDAILLASGRLDPTMGGPSDQQFGMKPGLHVTPVVEYGQFDWDRPKGHRRSVYRFVFRTLPDPFVDCLDGADASQPTPVRNVSVTAPQSLALFNNEFVLVHAKALAASLEKMAPAERITLACRKVWGRPPSQDEFTEFEKHAAKHGLASVCRVLFNSNEFLFVD